MLVKITGASKDIEEKVINKTEETIKKLTEYFDIDNIQTVKINIYSEREEFLQTIQKWYADREIPTYCKGIIQNGQIYYNFLPDYNQNKNKLSLYICQIVHEYIHILYNTYIHNRRKNCLARRGTSSLVFRRKSRYVKRKIFKYVN